MPELSVEHLREGIRFPAPTDQVLVRTSATHLSLPAEAAQLVKAVSVFLPLWTKSVFA
jgi:hypothetical protein